MAKTKWVELPPVTGRGKYERQPKPEHVTIADNLRSRPKEWAVVATRDTLPSARGFAQAIRTGHYIAFKPEGTFEATTRGLDVYARWTGK